MTPSGILDIIIIIFYLPAFITAIYAGLKHGFAKSAGWYNLNLLSIFRLVGSSLGLAAIYKPDQGVYIAALIFSSMGTISLLGALLGLVGRANESLKERSLPPRLARLVQLATLAAIVLAIVGGNESYNDDADTRAQGHTLSKVSIILLIIIYVVAVGICLHTLSQRHLLPNNERRLLNVCTISLPFILVRLILGICSIFLYKSSVFGITSTTHAAIIVRAIMGVLMEFIVVVLFLWAGCTVDRSAQREAERAQKHAANRQYQGHDGTVHGLRFDVTKQENSFA